jgi:hypothetical protein
MPVGVSPFYWPVFLNPACQRKINFGVYITIAVCQANKISNIFNRLLAYHKTSTKSETLILPVKISKKEGNPAARRCTVTLIELAGFAPGSLY